MSIFRACDVRGIYPDEFDEKKAYRIGRAFATMLDGGSVTVGADIRYSSEGLKTALIDGLVASGSEVTDVGTVPTPAFELARRRLKTRAGVMVTASCRQDNYNGLKITIGELPISPKDLSRLKSMVTTNGFLSQRRNCNRLNVIDDYENHILDFGSKMLSETGSTPKVVLDCGNGCLSEVAPRIFRALSVTCTVVNSELDGSFPSRHPNPFARNSLRDLSRAVLSEQAKLGIAFDAVGDRVAFIDERGASVSSDAAAAVLVSHLIDNNPGEKAVVSVKCGSVLNSVIMDRGMIPLAERSGKSFILTRMISEGARFGAGSDGHLFHKELAGGCDALYSALLVTSIVAQHGSLSSLVSNLPKRVTTNLRVRAVHEPNLLDSIAAAFPAERINRLDGVKILFEDGWGLARVSTTEPAVDFRFEGVDESALHRIIDEFLETAPALKREVIDNYRK